MLSSQKALTLFSSALISAVDVSCLNSKPTGSPWEQFTSRDVFSQRNLSHGDSKMPLSSKPDTLNKTKRTLWFSCLTVSLMDLVSRYQTVFLFFSASFYYIAHVTKFTTVKDGQESCTSQENFQAATKL